MQFLIFLPLAALVELSYAKLSCESCSNIRNFVRKSDVDIDIPTLCQEWPDTAQCLERMPDLWSKIQAIVLSREEGWFAPKNLCKELCLRPANQSDPSRGLSCEACTSRLTGSIEFFLDEKLKNDVVTGLQEKWLCNWMKNSTLRERCEEGVSLLLPPAFQNFSKPDTNWIEGTCRDRVECQDLGDPISCESCSGLGQHINKSQFHIDIATVCGDQPDPEECQSEFSGLWPKIVNIVFSSSDGWFSSKYLCKDLCLDEFKIDTKVSCKDCVSRLSGSLDYFDEEEVKQEFITGLKGDWLCHWGGDEGKKELCRKAVTYIIPRAFHQIATADRGWVEGLCRNSLSCV